jgi:hypothetical protein
MEWEDAFFVASSLPNKLRAGVERVLDYLRDNGLEYAPVDMFPSNEKGWYVIDFGPKYYLVKSWNEIDFVSDDERVRVQF